MLLQRYIKNSNAVIRLILLGVVLATAGCATTGAIPERPQQRAQPSSAGESRGRRARDDSRRGANDVRAGRGGHGRRRSRRRRTAFQGVPAASTRQYPGAHVNLAIIHTENDNDDEARAAIDAALALDPEHAPALNQLGMLLRRNGNFIEAEAAYLKAVTAAPDYALAHYNLGVLNELYLQRLDVALQHFERYQALVGEDKQVERWIADLKRVA